MTEIRKLRNGTKVEIEVKTKVCALCGKKLATDKFSIDQKSKDNLWRFCRTCESERKKVLRTKTGKDKPKASKVKKLQIQPVKKGKRKKIETVEDIVKRVDNLSPSSRGLHIENVTKEIKTWAQEEGYYWDNEHTLYIPPKAT